MATYEEVKDLPNTPEKFLIDVRNASEIEETGSIPGGINITLSDLEIALKICEEEFKKKYKVDKPNKEMTIIFSCKLGGRAQRATEIARSLGFKNAICYKGSWTEWATKEGL